jgi:hypothetical protein
MPPALAVARDELAALIVAARHWVDAATPVKRPGKFKPRLKQLLRGVRAGV